MDYLTGKQRLTLTLFVILAAIIAELSAEDKKISIHSVSVESNGPNKPALASIVVRTPKDLPAFVYWSDVTTWLPAQGHPNYTITQQAWRTDTHILLKSTVQVKQMLLPHLSYYYDYDNEYIVHYLPMSADVRSGDGSMIFHHTFDIPEKTGSANHTESRFRVIVRPDPTIHYSSGDQVRLQWRFLSRDEHEITMWRTVFESPTPDNDLDYADQMLYADNSTRMSTDHVLQFDHINITKEVYMVGKLHLVSITATINPTGEEDEALYVLFVKSRHLMSWEKSLNLRLSTRLLRQNVTSLLHNDVALALSYCDGNEVTVVNGTGYVSLNSSVENCVKCEAYGNHARDLIYTKDRYLVRSTQTNAMVYSSYYPETKSVMYTFREPAKPGQTTDVAGSGEPGEYYCRAILKNNTVVSRKFHVAWTKPVTLKAVINKVNNTEAEIECSAYGEPRPELTIWRCDGDIYCQLKKVDDQPGFTIQMTSTDNETVGRVTVKIESAARLKREAVLCRATNNYDLREDWLLFDDQVHIEEAEALAPEPLPEPDTEGQMPEPASESDKSGDDNGKKSENLNGEEEEASVEEVIGQTESDESTGFLAQDDATNGLPAENDASNGFPAQNDANNGLPVHNDATNGVHAQNVEGDGLAAKENPANAFRDGQNKASGFSANTDVGTGFQGQSELTKDPVEGKSGDAVGKAEIIPNQGVQDKIQNGEFHGDLHGQTEYLGNYESDTQVDDAESEDDFEDGNFSGDGEVDL